jgi:uncharacterized surface anchored protein
LQGAVFGVYTADSDIKTTELTSNTDGRAISDELPAGDYYLLEQKAPGEHNPVTDKIGVTVKAGEIAEKTVYYTVEVKTGNVRLTKRAENTGNLLTGAVFAVYNASDDKKVTELTTGADGTVVGANLLEGAYYLLEVKAPAGFIANTERIYFTVIADTTKEMELTNKPEEIIKPANSYIKVRKTAEGNGFGLPGAVFGLYMQGTDEKIGELTTGADGTATSAALTEGDYYLLELMAPAGYKLNAEKLTFHLNTGETKEITVSNTLDESVMPTGNLHLTKKAETTGVPLTGAVFGVYDAMNGVKVADITTTADGTAVCELPEGSYYLIEAKAPAGYILEPGQIPFTIAADNTVKVEVTNMAEKGGVRLTVKDVNGPALAGAVFGVYNASGVKLTQLTTAGDGKVQYDVPAGVYYMLEEVTPTGYTTGTERYSFYVTSGQTADVLVVKQKNMPIPTYVIPKTGEAFPWHNYSVAALSMFTAVLLCFYIVRSRRRI